MHVHVYWMEWYEVYAQCIWNLWYSKVQVHYINLTIVMMPLHVCIMLQWQYWAGQHAGRPVSRHSASCRNTESPHGQQIWLADRVHQSEVRIQNNGMVYKHLMGSDPNWQFNVQSNCDVLCKTVMYPKFWLSLYFQCCNCQVCVYYQSVQLHVHELDIFL